MEARPRPAFGHGSETRLGPGLPVLLGCYHPSRQNTNTGKLTPPMIRAVFARARALLEQESAAPPAARLDSDVRGR